MQQIEFQQNSRHDDVQATWKASDDAQRRNLEEEWDAKRTGLWFFEMGWVEANLRKKKRPRRVQRQRAREYWKSAKLQLELRYLLRAKNPTSLFGHFHIPTATKCHDEPETQRGQQKKQRITEQDNGSRREVDKQTHLIEFPFNFSEIDLIIARLDQIQ